MMKPRQEFAFDRKAKVAARVHLKKLKEKYQRREDINTVDDDDDLSSDPYEEEFEKYLSKSSKM